MTNRTIHFADDEQAVRRCWPVMHELRPHLSSADALVERHRRQTAEGCDAVHLDTGFHRTRAHRTYLRNRFEHAGFHMARAVDRGGGGA